MRGERRRTIQIVSHGPSCLDGVMAAATVARFYRGHHVVLTLASNADSDRTIGELRSKVTGGVDEIWITDLSWTSIETGRHLTVLTSEGTRVYWIDHHRTAIARANAPEFDVPFAGRVLSERFCAARLTFDFLKEISAKLPTGGDHRAFDEFFPFVAIADDHDRWLNQIPASADWALAVQTLGGVESYREIMRLKELRMTRRLKEALEAGRKAMDRSLELASATAVDRWLSNGLKVRSACCFGYSSEVAAKLYADQSETVIALFDLRSQGVSLRRSPDCEVDLSELARLFGGGGHAAAAGFALPELRRFPAEKLGELVGEKLEATARRA